MRHNGWLLPHPRDSSIPSFKLFVYSIIHFSVVLRRWLIVALISTEGAVLYNHWNIPSVCVTWREEEEDAFGLGRSLLLCRISDIVPVRVRGPSHAMVQLGAVCCWYTLRTRMLGGSGGSCVGGTAMVGVGGARRWCERGVGGAVGGTTQKWRLAAVFMWRSQKSQIAWDHKSQIADHKIFVIGNLWF